MGTRCFIGMENEDGRIRAIYSHWDGYPTHVGLILYTYYKSPVKVMQLLDLGDVSSLGAEIGEQHDFSASVPDVEGTHISVWTTAYMRDRGETNEHLNARWFPNRKEFLKACRDSWGEYAYLLTDKGWRVYTRVRVNGDKDLGDVLVKYTNRANLYDNASKATPPATCPACEGKRTMINRHYKLNYHGQGTHLCLDCGTGFSVDTMNKVDSEVLTTA